MASVDWEKCSDERRERIARELYENPLFEFMCAEYLGEQFHQIIHSDDIEVREASRQRYIAVSEIEERVKNFARIPKWENEGAD